MLIQTKDISPLWRLFGRKAHYERFLKDLHRLLFHDKRFRSVIRAHASSGYRLAICCVCSRPLARSRSVRRRSEPVRNPLKKPSPIAAWRLNAMYQPPTLPFGYDEVAFSRDVIARWGHICDALIDDDGLLHPQMGQLARLCEDHPEVALDVFEFLEGLLVRKDTISEIENAVAISFLDWERVQRLGFSTQLPTNIAGTIKEQWERDQQGI